MKSIIWLITIFIVSITGVLGEVVSLNTANFDSSIEKGTWFVKFFAPWCPHCQKLAPTWAQMATDNEDYLESRNFHVAEVDCTLEGDLCEKHDVDGYPKMTLFNEGVNVDTYDGKRDFDSLTTYVKSKADKYSTNSETETIEDLIDRTDDNEANPYGSVVLLTDSNFDQLTNNGIWFVKFFAPWCTHCQRLAPVWEELGHELQHKVNVGKVDCTVDTKLCQRFKVQGYPTLKLLQQPDDVIEYKGSRQLNSLREFAEKAAGAQVSEISAKDLDRVKRLNDVVFIYLYDDNAPLKILEMIKGLSRSFFSVKFYSSKDSDISAQLNIDKLPALVVLKDELQKNYPSESIESFSNREDIREWIQAEKYPLVPAMDSENYEDILGGDRLVVLGVFKPLDGPQFVRSKKNLKNTAKSYYQQIKESGGGEDGKSVIFAWLDGTRWSDYINGVYGITKDDIPTVLIADPVSNEYFDTTRSGKKLTLSDQEQLLESINDAKRGLLVGKSTMGIVEKMFRDIFSFGGQIQQSMFNHPFISLAVFCLIFGGIYRYCIIPQTRDVRDYERGDKFE